MTGMVVLKGITHTYSLSLCLSVSLSLSLTVVTVLCMKEVCYKTSEVTNLEGQNLSFFLSPSAVSLLLFDFAIFCVCIFIFSKLLYLLSGSLSSFPIIHFLTLSFVVLLFFSTCFSLSLPLSPSLSLPLSLSLSLSLPLSPSFPPPC